jgi:hypothetical protein
MFKNKMDSCLLQKKETPKEQFGKVTIIVQL